MKFNRIDDCHARAKVSGGWIIETVLRSFGGTALSIASCFMPDPDHEWILDDELVTPDASDTGD